MHFPITLALSSFIDLNIRNRAVKRGSNMLDWTCLALINNWLAIPFKIGPNWLDPHTFTISLVSIVTDSRFSIAPVSHSPLQICLTFSAFSDLRCPVSLTSVNLWQSDFLNLAPLTDLLLATEFSPSSLDHLYVASQLALWALCLSLLPLRSSASDSITRSLALTRTPLVICSTILLSSRYQVRKKKGWLV